MGVVCASGGLVQLDDPCPSPPNLVLLALGAVLGSHWDTVLQAASGERRPGEPEFGRSATWAGGRQKCRRGKKEARPLAGQAPLCSQMGTAELSPDACAVPEPSSELAQAGLQRHLLPKSSQLWFLGLLNRRPGREYAYSERVAKLNTGGQRANTGWNSWCIAMLTINPELQIF